MTDATTQELAGQDEQGNLPAQVRPHPPAEMDAFTAMIERCVRDSSVSLDRLEQVINLKERMEAKDAKRAFDAALSDMQMDLPTIDETGLIQIKEKGTNTVLQSSSYAKTADIMEAVRPIMADHGFAMSFRTGLTTEGKITVTGILSHRAGHREENTITLMHDSTGSKNAVQSVGSSITYGQRYLLRLMLNISSRAPQDMDDDGKAAGGEPAISDEQFDAVMKLADEVGADKAAFCKHLKIQSIKEMPASMYDKAIRALNAKKAQK